MSDADNRSLRVQAGDSLAERCRRGREHDRTWRVGLDRPNSGVDIGRESGRRQEALAHDLLPVSGLRNPGDGVEAPIATGSYARDSGRWDAQPERPVSARALWLSYPADEAIGVC